MNIQSNFSSNFRGMGHIKARDVKNVDTRWQQATKTIENAVKKSSSNQTVRPNGSIKKWW